jgi:hypothetical protein
MALHLDPGDLEPRREERTELLPGAEEKRQLGRTWQVASGTFACPGCDLPVATGGPLDLAAMVACPYCAHVAPARDYLALTDTPRPARVRVIAALGSGSGLGVERGDRDRAHRRRAAGHGHHEGAPAPG